MQSDQYESIATISELTGLNKNTLFSWIKKEKVQAKKLGQHPHIRWMINLDSLGKYLDQHLGKSQRGKKINIRISLPLEILPEQCDHHVVLKAQHQMKFVLSDELNAAERMDREEMLQLMTESLERLEVRTYKIVCMRHGLCGYKQMTLWDISQEIGRSRNRVAQLYNEGIAKLREDMLQHL